MRVLAISDIHGRGVMVRRLVEREHADAVVIAGDITNFQGRDVALEVLSPILRRWSDSTVAVFGNCDGRDVPGLLEEIGVSAHSRHVEKAGLRVTGLGGSGRTPFNTMWEFEEDAIFEMLSGAYVDGDVLLTHAPPYGTEVDRTFRGEHAGSEALRRFIELKQPPLVVCGHIHEAAGVDRIGDTVVINPGPLMRGHYAIVTLDGASMEPLDVEMKGL
ncbi:MAG: YfcE family phosphodiesterase [Thermococci archaeon]|nr:YfcE family phosphodiesterase [Thermococci archaeon]